MVGSTSLSATLAAAAVGWAGALGGIGLDIETGAPLNPALIQTVCHDDGLRSFANPAIDFAKLWFVAKESFYKAVSFRLRRCIEFHQAGTSFGIGWGSFTVTLAPPTVPSGWLAQDVLRYL